MSYESLENGPITHISRAQQELVAKIVKLGVSKAKAEKIVSSLSERDITRALQDKNFLRTKVDEWPGEDYDRSIDR